MKRITETNSQPSILLFWYVYGSAFIEEDEIFSSTSGFRMMTMCLSTERFSKTYLTKKKIPLLEHAMYHLIWLLVTFFVQKPEVLL
jgi:hypothetical protein